MEEIYIKLISIKSSQDHNNLQTTAILETLNLITEDEINNFNFQSLNSIFSKDNLQYLTEILCYLPISDITMSTMLYLTSQYDITALHSNNHIIVKLIDILANYQSDEMIFKYLQIICSSYHSVVKSLIDNNLLKILCHAEEKRDINIILLVIQELYIIDSDVLSVLQHLSSTIEVDTDIFLMFLSSIPVSATVTNEVLCSTILWNTILQNLVSTHSMDRKRAMYWLNRALNSLKCSGKSCLTLELSNEILFMNLNDEVINDILILIDTLEEKQTHVILPVLHKIDNLKAFFTEDQISIHWLLVVIERASIHESTVILKWALTEFLSLPIRLSSSHFVRNLTTSFLRAINNSNLYFSVDGISSDIGFFASTHLEDFLQRLFNELTEKENTDFLEHFLNVIGLYPWNSQALLFLSESFSTIKLTNTSFPISVLSNLGSLCCLNLVTMNLKYRQCVTSFFLTAFFANHALMAEKITSYINTLYTNFNLSETLLLDETLLTLLEQRFLSLSAADCDATFVTIIDTVHRLEINDVNFTATFNKLCCVSLIASLISSNVSDHLIAGMLDTFIGAIRETFMNPYSDFFRVLKAVIFLQQLHMVSRTVNIDAVFSITITDAISPIVCHVTKLLAKHIEESNSKDENQINCVSLLKYFVGNFSAAMVDTYFKENTGSSSVKTLIAANITTAVDGVSGDLDTVSLINDATFLNINAIQYERLVCLSRYLGHYKHHFHTVKRVEQLANFVCQLVDITVQYKGTVALIDLCGSILDHLFETDTTSVILPIVTCLWSSLLEHNDNAQIFWKLYSAFLDRVLYRLLMSQNSSLASSDVQQCLENIIDTVFQMGVNKFAMVHLLGSTVHRFFVTNAVTVEDGNCDFYIGLIGRLTLFGPCHRRGLRFENRIERYLSRRYGDRWKSYRINKTAESSERVGGILILCLKNAVSREFKEKMLVYLRDKDREIMAANQKGYKNYANNQVHRTRHRLFSAVLLLVHSCVVSLSAVSLEHVEQWMMESIKHETLNSIRHLAEWIYIILCSNDVEKQATLLSTLKSVSDSRPAYVCSLITICRHVIAAGNSMAEQLTLTILPLSSAQNYNVRLYAMCFVNIVQRQRLIDPSRSQLNEIIACYVSFLDKSSSIKNVKKLMDNFWWTKFDPAADVCLETVFDIMPRLFDLVEEESISLHQFQSLASDTAAYDIGFGNRRSVWQDCGDSVWRVKVDTADAEDSESGGGVITDLQKKVQPWISCRPDEDMLRELHGVERQSSDLVLVCSLIEKATNIGGLARSSNIFGVGELVVDNLKIREDSSFKQLAVTADKWVRMTQVAAKSLARFLALKRSQGYEIVAIEQTANSIPLQTMTFQSKTVLVLGNEKEGIPTELLSHMDKCIQIPQLGQIRSLNVHVSGAVVLWEYMKQMRLSATAD